MQVNATCHFWTVKAVLPSMMANNHGHIVTIASSAGMVGTPGLADYCASKVSHSLPSQSQTGNEMRNDERLDITIRFDGSTSCVGPIRH